MKKTIIIILLLIFVTSFCFSDSESREWLDWLKERNFLYRDLEVPVYGMINNYFKGAKFSYYKAQNGKDVIKVTGKTYMVGELVHSEFYFWVQKEPMLVDLVVAEVGNASFSAPFAVHGILEVMLDRWIEANDLLK